MDARDALRRMIDNSGETPAEIGQRIGKSRTYIYTLRTQKSNPTIDTYARLAHEFGYRLILKRPDGQEIELNSKDDAEEFRSQMHDSSPDERTALLEYMNAMQDPRYDYSSRDGDWSIELGGSIESLTSDPAFVKAALAFAEEQRRQKSKAEEAFFKRDDSDGDSPDPDDSQGS